MFVRNEARTATWCAVLLPGDTVLADSLKKGWWRVALEGRSSDVYAPTLAGMSPGASPDRLRAVGWEHLPSRGAAMNVHLPVLIRVYPHADVAVFLMRLLVGAVFITSGWSPRPGSSRAWGRARPATRRHPLAWITELAGGLGVALGMLNPVPLWSVLVMLGAIQKKIARRHTGFWGKHGPTAGTTS
jgi:hypothetical protein